MNQNPYAPPRSQPTPPPQKSLRLFTPLAIGVHAVLFPWFAMIFAIVNSVRLRRRGDVPLYGGLLIAMIAGNVLMLAQRSSLVSGGARIAMVLVGFATAWHQSSLVGPRLATDAAPARWYLWWIGLLPALFVFLVIWQFLSPARH